jgi:hypothetical protein
MFSRRSFVTLLGLGPAVASAPAIARSVEPTLQYSKLRSCIVEVDAPRFVRSCTAAEVDRFKEALRWKEEGEYSYASLQLGDDDLMAVYKDGMWSILDFSPLS